MNLYEPLSGEIKDQIVFIKSVLISFRVGHLKNLLHISKYFPSEPRLTKKQAQARENNLISLMMN